LNRIAARVNLPLAAPPLSDETILRQNEGEMGKELREGDEAPDFALPADSGGRVRLSDLKGKTVVLYFYPKDDTSGCTAEAVAFNSLKNEFAAAGAAVIGVSPDNAASHDKFKKKHDLDLVLAADPERKAIDAYGVWKEKSMYGRKYFGVERSTFLIDRNGRIAKIWRKVKVPGHAQEALVAARAL
jgi:peroxiredoxin Q/BCP